MEDSLKNFASQFNFKPEIENPDGLKKSDYKRFIIGGMGGSHLSADILKNLLPETSIIIHRNYGLPNNVAQGDTLFIASSFSGNTEETIDFAKCAIEKKLPLAIVASGGKLLELAEENNIPFIKLPNLSIQPRVALGYSIIALAVLFKNDKLVNELQKLSIDLDDSHEKMGKILAEELNGKIPLIYSSEKNECIGYNWKIKFNETGKIPAFYNVFPELNHNEMTGFDHNKESAKLSEKFFIIFLYDSDDDERIKRRMDVTSSVLEQNGVQTKKIDLNGKNRALKIFNSLLLADWTALYTAKTYGHDPENVPMVEKFKKMLN